MHPNPEKTLLYKYLRRQNYQRTRVGRKEQGESGTCPISFIIKGSKGDARDQQLSQATANSYQGIVTK